jgi:hypothetical protein
MKQDSQGTNQRPVMSIRRTFTIRLGRAAKRPAAPDRQDRSWRPTTWSPNTWAAIVSAMATAIASIATVLAVLR